MQSDFKGIGMTSLRTRDRLAETLIEMGIESEAVLDVIRNTALPIGFNQTISQPYIVAKMIEALIKDNKLHKVLEIGTGCGYQTFVLAQFVDYVYTVERIDGLLVRARERFQKLGCTNIRSNHSDGNIGWKAHAPYDGIIVSAAPIGVPSALREQLALDGRLIIPVGEAGEQKLLEITRNQADYSEKLLDSVSFVPMLAGTDATR